MIDEKLLIEEINMQILELENDGSNAYYLTLRVAEHVKRLIKRQPKVGEWIPVSERLPEEPMFSWQGYIVQGKRVVEPYSAYWDGEKWTDSEGIERYDIIAWMPLPERYKGGD